MLTIIESHADLDAACLTRSNLLTEIAAELRRLARVSDQSQKIFSHSTGRIRTV